MLLCWRGLGLKTFIANTYSVAFCAYNNKTIESSRSVYRSSLNIFLQVRGCSLFGAVESIASPLFENQEILYLRVDFVILDIS